MIVVLCHPVNGLYILSEKIFYIVFRGNLLYTCLCKKELQTVRARMVSVWHY